MAKDAFAELRWRGLIFDHTEGARTLLAKDKITIYNGFDPTGDSLHIGHLVPMMCMARLQRFGHTPIMVAGGGTGMIGDPSGKSTERNLLTLEQINHNLECVSRQLASVLDFDLKDNPALVVNNYSWLSELSMMGFLRDIGKHFTVNYMMAKDSVKSRLDREGEGISYTEFSYMLLQSYDFLHLFDNYNCQMQTGGSDQWGNITAGIELIRRVRGEKVQAMSYPLITRADGSKFGKTAAGESTWLDPQRTSPYRFYQFWLNTDDADVINYLKYFTWLERAKIEELEGLLLERPEKRDAQRRLAQEVTRMVHGETALTKAEQASRVLFGGDLDGLDASDMSEIFADVPSSQVAQDELAGEGLPLVDLLCAADLAKSKGDARRSISGGGVYLNNRRVTETTRGVTLDETVDGRFLLLRKGRKRYHLVEIVDS
ncbi:MAG: tyrosine--tRNA ligase [Candidatus Promineifilaceae bacterium]|nr:tyrosine--tRNA ligase [Candidatus Promineifilaceae bacterium]